MQNNITKFILTLFLIIFTLFINSFISHAIVITITLLVIMFTMDFKQVLYYLLKIKYLYLLILLVPFYSLIISILIKITIIYLIMLCYYKTTPLAIRYNTLYNVFKKIKMEKYTSNVLLFLPTLYKEFKKIKFVSIKNIFNNTIDRLRLLKSRFIGFDHQSIKFGSDDFASLLIIVLFFILTLYAR